jgi:hypothetical protein
MNRQVPKLRQVRIVKDDRSSVDISPASPAALLAQDFGVSERRETQRYELELSISFQKVPALSISEVLHGKTRNISTRGIYFTTNRPLAVNEVLTFSVNFNGLAWGADVVLTGRARVLRVVQNIESTREPIGVAVLTEDFRFVNPRREQI